MTFDTIMGWIIEVRQLIRFDDDLDNLLLIFLAIEMVELSRIKLSTEEIQSDCEDCLGNQLIEKKTLISNLLFIVTLFTEEGAEESLIVVVNENNVFINGMYIGTCL